MTSQTMNERPPRGLHNWAVVNKNEPLKGKPAVDVFVWMPKEIVRKDIFAIGSYLERELGWSVHRHGGWSGGGLMPGDDDLTIVAVKVRAREIRAALAAQRQYADRSEDPAWRMAKAKLFDADGTSATERRQARLEAVEELFAIEVRYEW